MIALVVIALVTLRVILRPLGLLADAVIRVGLWRFNGAGRAGARRNSGD